MGFLWKTSSTVVYGFRGLRSSTRSNVFMQDLLDNYGSVSNSARLKSIEPCRWKEAIAFMDVSGLLLHVCIHECKS